MEYSEIRKELAFIKGRIVMLDKMLSNGTPEENEYKICTGFIQKNINNWLMKGFVISSEMKKEVQSLQRKKISIQYFNKILSSYCRDEDIIMENDKAKRINDKVIKCYFFYK